MPVAPRELKKWGNPRMRDDVPAAQREPLNFNKDTIVCAYLATPFSLKIVPANIKIYRTLLINKTSIYI